MKKIILLSLLVLFCTLIFSSPIAVISGMKGDISISRNEERFNAKTGDLLNNNDELISGIESFASIRFIDNGATAKLFPNSVLVIHGENVDGKLSKRSSLERGNFLSKVNINSGPYVVETPNTVASVKGTEFLVGFENFITTVNVKSGEVDIESKVTGNTTSAGENEAFTIDEGGTIAGAQYVDPSSLDDFTDDVNPEDSIIESKIFEIEMIDKNGNIRKVRITYE